MEAVKLFTTRSKWEITTEKKKNSIVDPPSNKQKIRIDRQSIIAKMTVLFE